MSDIRTNAVFKIAQVKRPTSGKVYGERMVIAIPNTARYDPFSREYVQSFAKKWLITESCPYPVGGITQEIQRQWVKRQESWHKCRAIGAAI